MPASLVLDYLRSRRADHGAANAVVDPAWRACCAACAIQAKSFDARSDAQPGKILHEMRAGENGGAARGAVRLYYGGIDATPLFVLLAGAYVERTGDEKTLRELWPSIEARARLDRRRAIRTGMASSNTGARPSRDWPIRAGRIRDAPSSTLTDAWRKAISPWPSSSLPPSAWQAVSRGGHDALARARYRSDAVAERFEAAFWCPRSDLRSGARRRQGALPRAHVECRTGAVYRHCTSRPRRGGRRGLMETSSIPVGASAPWPREARYNPMSYHNGSILAARQSLIGSVCPLWLRPFGRAAVQGPVKPPPTDAPAAELYCGFQRAARARADTLSGRLLAAGGPAPPVRAA